MKIIGGPFSSSTAVNAMFALPFVDTTGSGTFTITVEGVATGAITYSATAATLVSRINTAIDAALGASQVVASGASLAALILTCSGVAYAARPVAIPTVALLGGATGFTAGPATVTTAGVSVVTLSGLSPVPRLWAELLIDNEGSSAGFFSADDGATWSRIPAGPCSRSIQNFNTSSKQIIIQGSGLASLYLELRSI